ncbi:MAG: flavodoxin [Flexilinea flocculi]|jgi:menaquinone-dependent protoporphyrinogen IX oxidase|nr:flavodoxin [Flexilinea flocculi]
MKTVVIFQSKTGYTKKYAQWIAEALQADLFENSKIKDDEIISYDAVVYGGSLFATGILGLKRIKKLLPSLAGKKIAVFGVGLSPVREDTINSVKQHNLTEEELKAIHFYYFRGGFNLKKLSFIDQTMMKMMKSSIEKKKKAGKLLTEDENEMLEAFNVISDFTDRSAIEPLLSFIQS